MARKPKNASEDGASQEAPVLDEAVEVKETEVVEPAIVEETPEVPVVGTPEKEAEIVEDSEVVEKATKDAPEGCKGCKLEFGAPSCLSCVVYKRSKA